VLPVFIAGKVNLTTKGIPKIPNMSPGKPELMLDFSAGKGRWSFDPQLYYVRMDSDGGFFGAVGVTFTK